MKTTNNPKKVSCNGEVFACGDRKVSCFDRGLVYGDGVFTTMRLCDGVVENFEKHLIRLEDHCRALHMIPPSVKGDWVAELVKENRAEEGIWKVKIILTGGPLSGLDLQERAVDNVLITMEAYKTEPLKSRKISLYPYPVLSPTAKFKTLAYLDRLWIKDYASRKGTNDALTAMPDGALLEASSSNIFWIDNESLYTPSFDLPLLKGTYLTSVIEGAEALGLLLVESKNSAEQIPPTAKVFLCNAMTGIQPVVAIEEKKIFRDEDLEHEILRATGKIIAKNSLCIELFT